MDVKALWQAVLGELEVTVSRANYSTWFRHTSIVSNENGHIIVAVPNIFTKQWLETKYHDDIHRAIGKLLGNVETIEYKVSSSAVTGEDKAAGRKREPLKAKAVQTTLPSAPAANHNLNTRYTFDTYVVGSSNELAYAACQAVAKEPGTKYNPLYLYGGVGLGKTHLMQAVGNEILKRDPSQRIEYVTIESFTNEFINAIQKKKNGSFVDKYRNIDVLIIDDMQFLAGKEKTQDEFFHTFNALHQTNKQIIISSDKAPQLLTNLEDRLLSRFAMGMTADVQTPDLETRSAIVQSKAAEKGIILPLDVVEYLARHSQNNIRELEGALTKLIAHCELHNVDPSVEAAQLLVAGVNAGRPKLKPMSPRTVIDRVAAYFDLQAADILGSKRDKDIVVPRQIVMYLMFSHCANACKLKDKI